MFLVIQSVGKLQEEQIQHLFNDIGLFPSKSQIFEIVKSISISLVYFIFGVIVFYVSYFGAKKRGTLINMGE